MKPFKIIPVINAGGFGKRMKSDIPKPLVPLQGKPMIAWLLETLKAANFKEVIITLAYEKDLMKTYLAELSKEYKLTFKFVEQEFPKGTIDALIRLETILKNFEGHVLILDADLPLIRPVTIKKLCNYHIKKSLKDKEHVATVIVHKINKKGFLRIFNFCGKSIIKRSNDITKYAIVGVSCFNWKVLYNFLKNIHDETETEHYLIVLNSLLKSGYVISFKKIGKKEEFISINTQRDLELCSKIINNFRSSTTSWR